MTRSLHRPAAILLSLLVFSACEKKEEASSSSSSSGEGGSAAPGKPTRTERRGGTRAERETAAKSDLQEAFEAAQQEADPAAREIALAQVAWDGIDIDRELAQKAFLLLTPGGEQSLKLVAHFAMRFADEDTEAALEWARSLEQPLERQDALSRIATVIATKDPARAAALATEEVPEGPLKDRAVVQVVQRWSQSAPSEAGMFVSSLPSGSARTGALMNLAKTWSEADASGFANWASQQETQLPEMTFAVAAVLRTLPDEEARTKRLAAFTDPAFRKRVEAELNKTVLKVPPMPPKPPTGLPPGR